MQSLILNVSNTLHVFILGKPQIVLEKLKGKKMEAIGSR